MIKNQIERERDTHTQQARKREREKKNGKFTKIFFNEISENT